MSFVSDKTIGEVFVINVDEIYLKGNRMNNQAKPLISVIVPAYKVETDIQRCIESVQSQTYENLEIILVDDGSPDKCGDIFEQAKLKDRRIVVIHKENGGLSDARNAALDIMKGTYVTFVDGDDYVDKNYVTQLYAVASKYNVPISVCDEQRFSIGSNGETIFAECKASKGKEYLMTGQEGIIEFLYQRKFETSAWGKLYLSKLFADVRYPKGKQFEDLATTYKLFIKTENIVFFDRRLYMYQVRMESQMRRSFNLGKVDGIYIADAVREELKNVSNKFCKACDCRCVSMYFHVFLDIPNNEYRELQAKIWKKIKINRRKVLLDINARKKTKMAVVLSYFGKSCCRNVFRKVNQ